MFLKPLFLAQHFFLLYITCDIAIYADDATLYFNGNQTFDLWQELELACELESDLQDTVDWDTTWLVDFNVGKVNLFHFDKV